MRQRRACWAVMIGETPRIVLAFLLLLGIASVSSATPIGSPLATEALATCREADWMAGEKREDELRHGMQLAEEALATYEADAAAHFALFCNLGKHLQAIGIRPWILADVRR